MAAGGFNEPPPPRTPDQLETQREEALRTRRHRAGIKASIASGKVTLASVLDMGGNGVGDPLVGRIKIGQAIRAKRGWGAVNTARLLALLEVSPETRLDKLPEAKRQKIIAAVEG